MSRKSARILKRLILFVPLLFVIFTCGRLFILANNSVFLTETEMPPWMVNGFARRDHLARDRLQMNVSVPKSLTENEVLIEYSLHKDSHKEPIKITLPVSTKTESLETVKLPPLTIKLPPFVDYCDASCPGENGTAVNINRESLKSEEEKARFDQGLVLNSFSQYVSDMISVHRRLPDCRSDICRKLVENFNGTLPEISVIIIFYNEAWTPLLRSVHSVIDRTPAHLLKQIILVDDNSSFEFLKTPLDKYFSSFPVVQIIHSPKRLGLIKARLVGFEASVAPVVVFLDSHIECFPGWAEPMLVRISRDQKTVLYPLIPVINTDTFELKCFTYAYEYCNFDWKRLQMMWEPVPARVLALRRDESDSIQAPVMPGGLFAIHREFFQQLGTYDPELVFWGGENMELSFKTWMCGGSLQMDPCSTVGHVYRSTNPHAAKILMKDVTRNAHRVAEVWMDDYKNYFYERNNYQFIDVGNITDRLQLRASLQCKSFEWFLKNITPEKTYPHNLTYVGLIQSKANSKCIIHSFDKNKSVNRPALKDCKWPAYSPVWYMGASAQISQDDVFLCVDNGTVVLHQRKCKESQPQWQYREERWLYHIPTGQCLTIAADSQLVVSPCTNSGLQLWYFQKRRSDLKFPSYL